MTLPTPPPSPPELLPGSAEHVPSVYPRRWKRRPLSVAERIWAVLVPSVTVLAVTVTAISMLGERQSSVEHLSIKGVTGAANAPVAEDAPVEEFETIGSQDPYWFDSNADRFSDQWLIPASAPIGTFPKNPSLSNGFYSCSEEQVAWLRKYAQQTPGEWRTFLLTLHSSATTGGSLSLNNIRFDGREVSSEPLVHFQCPQGGKGLAPVQVIYISTSGQPARWGEERGDNPKPEGSPATINIDPGAAKPVMLLRAPEVDTQRLYKGRFLADIVETGETVVLAGDIAFRREKSPGFFFGYGSIDDPELYCETPNSIRTPCTPAEAVEVLRAAQKGGLG